MENQREIRLLMAFRAVCLEEQDLILGLTETRAAKVRKKKRPLTLVVTRSNPSRTRLLGGGASEVEEERAPHWG